MSISEYLDVFIGLAFTYLILSLIVTVIFESIVQFTRLRARNLQRALRKLLEGMTKVKEEGSDHKVSKPIVDVFYDHPIVRSLGKEKDVKPDAGSGTGEEKSVTKRSWEVVRSKPHFSYIEPATFGLVALNTLFPEDDLGNKNVEELIGMTEKLPDSKIKTVLLTHLRGGADNLKKLREGVEQWFNDTMDRLSGWFTRTARWMSLVIGLIVAIVLNVDSLVVANAFWTEPTLRTSVASYAAENYKNFPPDSTLTKDDIGDLRKELETLELPIGWNTYGPDKSIYEANPGWLASSWAVATQWAPGHIIGWIFTALAVSLGAHFWFDLLSRIVKLRASGKPPTVKPKEEEEEE